MKDAIPGTRKADVMSLSIATPGQIQQVDAPKWLDDRTQPGSSRERSLDCVTERLVVGYAHAWRGSRTRPQDRGITDTPGAIAKRLGADLRGDRARGAGARVARAPAVIRA